MRAWPDTEALHIDCRGMFGDREYMWVEAAPHVHVRYLPGHEAAAGKCVTQREDPVLTGIIPQLEPDGVLLSWRDEDHDQLFVPRREDAPEHRVPVSVWSWEGEAVDQGDEAAKWGEDLIGRPVRLVAISDPDTPSAYAPGDRVFHQKFGYGRVMGVEGNKLSVTFEVAGEKKVIDSFVSRA